jgi:hypothetical protein
MKIWLNDLVEYFNYNFIVNMLLLVSSRLQQTIANSYLYNEGFFSRYKFESKQYLPRNKNHKNVKRSFVIFIS